MELNRRGFLGGLLAAIVAPAIVKAPSLMPLRGKSLTEILASPYEEWICRWAEATDFGGLRSKPSAHEAMTYTMRAIGGRHFSVYAANGAYQVGQTIRVWN